MRQVIRAVVIGIATFGLSSGVAVADTQTIVISDGETNFSCTLSNTGVDSVSSCINEEANTTTFICSNDIDVTNSNEQIAASGTATVEGNGSGGDATSGNTDNSTLTAIAVRLGCESEPAPVVTPPTPVTPAVTPTPQVLSETTQVVKPVGAVHAGAGAAVQTNTSAAIAGLVASSMAIAAGVALRMRIVQNR